MKNLFITVLILTLSSCMVSKKAYDAKCCELEEVKADATAEKKAFDMKDHICRTKVNDLYEELKNCQNEKSDTTETKEQE